MIDFHTHILPHMDDGSSSAEESLAMLKLLYEQGVNKVNLTPHYYAERESPEEFIKRRSSAYRELILERKKFESLKSPSDGGALIDLPEMHLGAEVYYFSSLIHMKDLKLLCLDNGSILLLEMPFRRWSVREVENVEYLHLSRGIQVVLAHIDRYVDMQPFECWKSLYEKGVRFQLNANAMDGGFLHRHKIKKLVQQNLISWYGSDCHNMRDRMPNMDRLSEFKY